MTTRQARVYTGPTLVHAVAQHLRRSGVDVQCEGTMHVYWHEPDAGDETFYRAVERMRAFSVTFGPADVWVS